MVSGIKKEVHGVADYIYVPLVLAAPKLLKFENEQPAAGICYAMASGALAYTLCTDAPWGVAKIIPYKTHAAIDLCSGIFALAAPFILPVRKRNARTTLLLIGVTGLLIGALSVIGASRPGAQ